MKQTALLILLTLSCQPIPDEKPGLPGLAQLKGVTFERLQGAHRMVHLEAPRAELALDGTQVTMHDAHGTAQEKPGSARVHLQATELEAQLVTGRFELLQVRGSDDEGRVLESPRVTGGMDGGMARAEAPVRMHGRNFWVTAQDGAVVDMQHGTVDLLGPVEARAWPGDGGAH